MLKIILIFTYHLWDMKNLWLSFICFQFLSLPINSSAQAPNTWTQKANFGGAGRSEAVGFSIGAKGYIGTGSTNISNYSNDFWEYDTTTNAWTQKANFGGTSRNSAVGFSIGSKGYIGTGQDISTYKNDFWEYNPSSNLWTQKANFGGSGRWQAVGFSIGNKGYLGTGWSSISYLFNDFWEYDPSSDIWTQKANFGGGLRTAAVGFHIGSKGYIGTGATQLTWGSKDFWEYDPSTNTWTQKTDFGGTARDFAGGFNIGTKGYIGTGNAGPTLLNDFWEYDPSSDTWTQKANFGGGAWDGPVGFCIGTKGYFGTGVSILTGTSNAFWEYTPTCILPNAPTNTTPFDNQSICSGYSTTLSASGTGTFGWYNAASGGTWLGGGNTYTTPVLTNNTTYYVQDSNSCGASLTRTSILVTVNAAQWVQEANFGGTARSQAVGFSIGTRAYIGTGLDLYGNSFKDFWEYDPSANTWTQKADFGGSARYDAVGFCIGTKGYIGTGIESFNSFKNDFWEYDPSANTWTQKANFGGTKRRAAVGFSIGAKGYIGTGSDTTWNTYNYKKDFWEYDPSTNTWTQKADCGGPGRLQAVGFSINSKGYIGTGYNNYTGALNDFWEYNPSTNTWTQKANFGGTPRSEAIGFGIGTKGYIGTAANTPNDFWEYDPSTNTWTQKAVFSGNPRQAAVGFSRGNKGYIGTGLADVPPNFPLLNDFWEFTGYCGCTTPNAPTNTTPSGNQSICSGNSTTLSASGTGTLGWYNAPTGGTWLGGGNNFTTPIFTTSTTYYVQDSSSCGVSITRTSIPVTVNPSPVPTITGQNSMCINSGYYNYTTEAGMTNYIWTVSSGGIINYGSGTNQIQVSWIIAGPQTVSVTYSNGAGCNPITPTVLNVTVNPLPGQAGAITGTANVCAGASGIAYSIAPIPNTTTYVWALPPNATIASGAGTNSITVNFAANVSSGNIIVYGNNICGDGQNSPPFAVSVTPLPAAAGNITGPDSVCQGSSGKVYKVPSIYGAIGYTWTLPTGATAGSGSNSDSITVDYSNSAVSGNITVYGNNSCGNGTVSPNFFVSVNPIPPTPVVTLFVYTLFSSANAGNQWYYQGTLIPGATGQTYSPIQLGYYWTIVTINGCSSDTSNHEICCYEGIGSHSSSVFEIYPVPNDGMFNVSITTSEETFSIVIYNTLGLKVYEEMNIEVHGSLQKGIDLRPVPNGVYTVIFKNSQNQVVKKILVNK
jgi:hypothetical protein